MVFNDWCAKHLDTSDYRFVFDRWPEFRKFQRSAVVADRSRLGAEEIPNDRAEITASKEHGEKI